MKNKPPNKSKAIKLAIKEIYQDNYIRRQKLKLIDSDKEADKIMRDIGLEV